VRLWTEKTVIAPFMETRTAHPPGISPMAEADWLYVDDSYAAQMAARDRLIAERREDVFREVPEGAAAAAELMEAVAAHVVAHCGAAREGRRVTRPDGVVVDLDGDAPMVVAGRLAQENFLAMLKPEGAEEHVLVSGVLCFPAHWTLSEKIGRPLIRIHKPVRGYEEGLASRVQRLFDGVRPGRPLVRANWHFSATPEIYTPMREDAKVHFSASPNQDWLRVERQTVLRLPETGAAIFGVRTIVTPLDGLTREQWRGIARAIGELGDEERARKAGPELAARIAREAG
jgi:hypothetical protein